MGRMTFTGWPPEAVAFFEGLEADNSRAYWQAHKATYAAAVRQPMEELLAELAEEFGEGRIFRPYRDVRFSADKSPYKTAIGATLAGGGYVQFSADGLAAGAGMYEMAPDQLERYRQAVAADPSGADLTGLVADLRSAGNEVTAREMLKTAPKGYPRDHPRVELLRHKGVIAWREWPPETCVGTPEARTVVTDFLRAARPLLRWLDRHVGPSRQPPTARR